MKPIKGTELRGANLWVLKPPLLVPPKTAWCKPLRFQAALLVSQYVIIIQLLSFPSRPFQQSTISSCLSCRPPSPTAQHSLCLRPPTTPPCRAVGTTIVVQRRCVHSEPCLRFSPLVFDPDLPKHPQILYRPRRFFHPPHCHCHG